MKLRDMIEISVGNLWRMKLRASLTISGVVIAIAAFVSMLSFAAGMEENVSERFDRLGLLSTMQVYQQRSTETDTTTLNPLDDGAIEALLKIPGVTLAYPYDVFDVTVEIADTQFSSKAQALSGEAARTRLFSQFLAGKSFTSDMANQAVVTESFMEDLGIDEPDSLIGKKLIVSIGVSSLDSALAHLIESDGETFRERFSRIDVDSLIDSREYLKRTYQKELSEATRRFLEGYFGARDKIADTLQITGVIERTRGRSRSAPILVPVQTGKLFSSSGFSGNPLELLSTIQSGTFFESAPDPSSKSYSRVTIEIEPTVPFGPVKDSVTALGFRSFSYAEEFEEIRNVFVYFNMVIGLIGFLALITVSLGIVNTMVMAIMERRREIGVLKSLGADESEIKLLFLTESGVIGVIGATAGIVFGWLITRVASFIAKDVMVSKEIDPIELFSLPIWLILAAFALGLIVSLAAGYYPASRAARVDPVQALRSE
ncbi:MAG: ABC transporter permease [candidate division Zixibacteria bacterium]|nr:ABC transporter permease [candidate division Zixibacteria bacterium]